MDYIYEAVYFFNRINCRVDDKTPQLINQEEFEKLGITDSVYKAIMRILVVNNLLDYDRSNFVMTNEHNKKHRLILDKIIDNKHHEKLFDKAVNESQFFFDNISELEYEIYSRCNFSITFKIGNELVKHVNFSNKKVLELGGNSGGLGTAVLTKNEDCVYSIVDTKIPCMIGNELKNLRKLNKKNIKFIEGNIFELMLPTKIYDYIIIMNLLHDFDDLNCLNILRNCTKYCDTNTKFLIIEDILTSEFEPKEVIMHGLRLSVECRGGKQRTIEELVSLFSRINYKFEKAIKINKFHTMLVMQAL